MAFEKLSPVGRLVGGSPIKGYQDTDDKTGVKLFNEDGSPKMSYMAMLAIEKANPEWQSLYTQLWNEGRGAFPHLFDANTGACIRPDFSWKITDGDGVDKNGKKHSEKDGYAGCMVLKIESNYPFTCYDQANYPVTDEAVIYRGCYIRVAMKCQGNNATGNQVPGIKIYPQALQLVGHGTRISGGVDAATVFAAPLTAGYVPAGMSATPLAGSAPPVQQQMQQAPQQMQQAPMQMGQQPQQAAPMQMQQAPMQMQQAPQQAAPMQMQQAPQQAAPMQVAQPDQAFVQQALGQQQPAPMQMQQAAPMQMQQAAPQYQMTAAAGGHSREAWHANGNTDDQLLAAGMMVRIN